MDDITCVVAFGRLVTRYNQSEGVSECMTLRVLLMCVRCLNNTVQVLVFGLTNT